MGRKTRFLSLALCLAAVLALCACGISRDDVTTYIQGELDCTYKGVYHQDYLDLVDGMTQEDAQAQYEGNRTAEAERLLTYLGVEFNTSEAMARAEEVVAALYEKAEYSVGKADKLQSGDFAVEVTVYPVEVFHLLSDEIGPDTWYQVQEDAGITTQEQLDALSQEEYQALDTTYALAMLDEVEALLPQATKGTAQPVMLQLKSGEDGYSLVSSGWQTLDDMILDYGGNYLP